MVAIGIDLGTTNTVVAAVVNGVAVTLEDENGRRLLPSVVSFDPSSTVFVGEPARERRLVDPENTIFSTKPLLGRPWGSPEVKAAQSRFPFKLAQGNKNSTMVVARDAAYAIPEISAFVLRRAKAIAESVLREQVRSAVITVPANFNDLQRASTKIAGKLAGLEVMRILNEPTAAALAYGQAIAKPERIAVYDLGGGTFDVTLLDLAGTVFEVLATAGDTTLGGDDIDRAIADTIAERVRARFGVDPRTVPGGYVRLTFVAEEIKKQLSLAQRVEREISGVAKGPKGDALGMTFSMTRAELEKIVAPLIARTIDVSKRSIEAAGLAPTDFDRVIMVGGSTRMPLVCRMVEETFGKAPHLRVNPDEVVALGAAIQAHALDRSRGPAKRPSGFEQLSQAESATSRARSTTRPPVADPTPAPPEVAPRRRPPIPAKKPVPSARPDELRSAGAPSPLPDFFAFDKAPATISFSGVPNASASANEPPAPAGPLVLPALIPRARPREHTVLFESADAIRKDEVSALSDPFALDEVTPSAHAGVSSPVFDERLLELDLSGPIAPPSPEQFLQGSAIETAATPALLIDVTPLSLGVETVGGYADVLIPANSPVPCDKRRIFLTASDGQTVVSIRVAQGESKRFVDNTRLGDLELSGLRHGRRGDVKIAVTFELDADGILNVRAEDVDTGRETTAAMRIIGASTEASDVGAMLARQARHDVTG